jgi:hypothetical protein
MEDNPMTKIHESHAGNLGPGEYVHVPELNVYRAKDKTGRVDAFKTEAEAKAHTEKDPFAKMSKAFKPVDKDKTNMYGFSYTGKGYHTPKLKLSKLKEDAPTSAVGGGAVAGLGVGAQGEPPVKKKKDMKTFKRFAAESWGSPENAGNRAALAAEFEKGTYRKGKKFQPPGYKGSTGHGHHWLSHKGRDYHWTGTTGKEIATGKDSYQYSHKSEDERTEHRAWVNKDGKITED